MDISHLKLRRALRAKYASPEDALRRLGIDHIIGRPHPDHPGWARDDESNEESNACCCGTVACRKRTSRN